MKKRSVRGGGAGKSRQFCFVATFCWLRQSRLNFLLPSRTFFTLQKIKIKLLVLKSGKCSKFELLGDVMVCNIVYTLFDINFHTFLLTIILYILSKKVNYRQYLFPAESLKQFSYLIPPF